MNTVGIRFKGNSKVYCFKNESLELKSDMLVIPQKIEQILSEKFSMKNHYV